MKFMCLLLTVALILNCQRKNDENETSRKWFPYEWIGNIDQEEFDEPSGICWHEERKSLFVAGDDGDLREMKKDGTVIQETSLDGRDLEGITVEPVSGLLYVVVEGDEEILEISPDGLKILRTFQIPREYEGKTVMNKKGDGIEGIAYIPSEEPGEEGVFWVCNQSFDLTDRDDFSAIYKIRLHLTEIHQAPEIIDCEIPNMTDLAGICFEPVTERVFVVSDANNVLLEYSRDFQLMEKYSFPGEDQEGICFDDEGFMYIAQDCGGVIQIKWNREN